MPRRSYSRKSPMQCLSSCSCCAPVIIFKTDDVVFSEIRTILNFDDVQGVLTRILQPVLCLDRNGRALPDLQVKDFLTSGHPGGAGDHNPMFAALVVELQGQAAAGVDRDPLHLVARPLFENLVGAPGPMHGQMLQMLWGPLLLENVDDPFYVLSTGLGTDERGIRSIYHDHVGQTDRCHDPPVSKDHRPLAPNIDDSATDDVAGLVLRGHFVQAAPTPDVGPLEAYRHHGRLVGLFHDAVVYRDGRQPAVLVIDGSSCGLLLHQAADVISPTRQRGLMASDLLKNRGSAPDEHPAVPVIIARLKIVRRLDGIGLFDEAAYTVALERSSFTQHSFAVRLDVAIAGFGPDRLDPECDQQALFSEFSRQSHRGV